MKLYIAGTIHDPRIKSGEIQQRLEELEHTIVSRWHRADVWQPESRQQTFHSRASIAEMNYRDLDSSDAVVAVPHHDHHLRGLHTEVGYAIGKGKKVYLLGDPNSMNTMTVAPNVHYIQDLYEIG